MDSVEKFKILSNSNLVFLEDLSFPTNVQLIPTDTQYEHGIIKRTFCLTISSGKIVEIMPRDISKFSNNIFLKLKSVHWKISGKARNYYKGEILYEEGATEFNSKSIIELENSGFQNIRNTISPLNLYKNYF